MLGVEPIGVVRTGRSVLDDTPVQAAANLGEEGIFAMRGPRRPVPIGLSLVEVAAVEDSSVRFRGVDVVDGTPLLDLKPYFADADRPRSDVRCGWFDEISLPDEATPGSLRSQRS